MQGWDTIVIGSGAGGLTAAVALSRAGQRVLVLEQHYLPGGFCQSFALEGYRFSPGIHYIGECGPGGGMRRVFEGLELTGELELCELNPDGFDHFLIAGERFDVPRGRERYIARLIARFPHEREGIRRYFDTLSAVHRELLASGDSLGFPRVLGLPFRARELLRWGFRTQGALLDATVRDPLLRAILSAQSGDHGLAPSRVSLPLHASMVVHYLDGAFYPRGGAKRLPLAMIKALRRRGGQIRLRARVARILVEGGRAVGVELSSGERIAAGTVVSNADPAITFGKLVPEAHGGRERRKARGMAYSVSLISLFCAVDLDLRRMGFDSGNLWWYRHRDVGAIYEAMEKGLPGDTVDGLFLAITTLKDPGSRGGRSPQSAGQRWPQSAPAPGHGGAGHHVIEMFTFVPYGPFARWMGTPQGQRGADYEQLKEALGDKMIAAAENVIPGISRALRFRSVASPVSNDFYCETPYGAAYGTAKTPSQLGPFSFPIRTSVAGLYCVGASTISHGLGGVMMSGLAAAQAITGVARVEELLGPADGSLRVVPADRPEEWLHLGRRRPEAEEIPLGEAA